MEFSNIVDLVGISISIIAIVAVLIFIYWQTENTKKYVRNELKTFATAVNDAQYNEFVFDKKTEMNIKNIDKRLQEIGEQLKKLNV